MRRNAGIIAALVALCGCATSNNTLYGVGTTDDALSTIDPATGAMTRVGPLDPAAPGPNATQGKFSTPASMARRPSDNLLFTWNNTGVPVGATDRVLAIVDRCSGYAAEVARTSTPPQNTITALAFASDGTLYGFGNRGSSPDIPMLYRIDTATGSQTLVGPVLGVPGGSSSRTIMTGADFSSAGVLYGALRYELTVSPGGPYMNMLVRVDPATGAAANLGTFSVDVGMPGSIAFDASGKLIGSGSGGPSGTILYTINTGNAAITEMRTLSGAPLQGLGFGPERNDCAAIPPTPWRSVTSHTNHVCALAIDGRAFCWGYNNSSNLGDGSSTDRNAPTAVRDPANALPGLSYAKLWAGESHTCGITPAGAMYCWGSNGSGELGTGGGSSSVPVLVNPPESLVDLAPGGSHACGLTAAGRAYCWGYDTHGSVGDGVSAASTRTPVLVLEPFAGARFRQLSSGQHFTCGVATTGDAYCWGMNDHGQLGDGNGGTGVTQDRPVAVVGGYRFQSVSAGMFHTCGITDTNIAVCWGGNYARGLGYATTESCWNGEPCSRTPRPVSGAMTFASVDAGANHTCALTSSGLAYCWGMANSGQLGIGYLPPYCPSSPARCMQTPTAVHGGRAYQSLATGQAVTCGVDFSGVTYCWGGQPNTLGIGVTNAVSDKPIPIAIP